MNERHKVHPAEYGHCRPLNSQEHRVVNVEVPPLIRDTAARLGAGVPYALKVLTGQLADDPDMGRPSNLPGILTVLIDGELFEDCPDLAVGYIREPDRIEIRYLNLAPTTDTVADAQDEEPDGQRRPLRNPSFDALAARQVADAWVRISGWLQRHAPDSYAALRSGAGSDAIASLEGDLGIRTPIELRILWTLTAGDDGADGWGCLPGNQALLPLETVVAVYRLKMDSQRPVRELMSISG